MKLATDPASVAEREASLAATLAALRKLGEASTVDLADALGITGYQKKILRSRLTSWARQGLVRERFELARNGTRVTVWSAPEVGERQSA